MPALTYSDGDFATNDTMSSTVFNNKFNAVSTLLNTTKLDDDNIQDAGITASDKVIDATVTEAKLDASTTSLLNAVRADVYNLGITLAGGVFSVSQADGSALSSSDYGKILMQSTTGGQTVELSVTANASFNDDANASSDITGVLFGNLTSVAWDKDRPFFLYAVNRDDTSGNLLFGISQNPIATQTPGSTKIAYKGNTASSDDDTTFFLFTDTDPTTNYANKPVKLIGGIRMRMSASDDWTVQSLSSSEGDGIREEPYKGKWFDMVPNVRGAKTSGGNYTGVFHNSSGGAAPYWTDNASLVYKYSINPSSGEVTIGFDSNSAGDYIVGVGAQTVYLALPYSLGEIIGSSSGSFVAKFAPGDGQLLDSTTTLAKVTSSSYRAFDLDLDGTAGSSSSKLFFGIKYYTIFSE